MQDYKYFDYSFQIPIRFDDSYFNKNVQLKYIRKVFFQLGQGFASPKKKNNFRKMKNHFPLKSTKADQKKQNLLFIF